MIDINRYKFYMVQILKEIYADIELANCLGFKGGTAMMFFYDLPRFSVDMDFNLLCNKKEDIVIDNPVIFIRKFLLSVRSHRQPPNPPHTVRNDSVVISREATTGATRNPLCYPLSFQGKR